MAATYSLTRKNREPPPKTTRGHDKTVYKAAMCFWDLSGCGGPPPDATPLHTPESYMHMTAERVQRFNKAIDPCRPITGCAVCAGLCEEFECININSRMLDVLAANADDIALQDAVEDEFPCGVYNVYKRGSGHGTAVEALYLMRKFIHDGEVTVCKSCHTTLKKGAVPKYSIAKCNFGTIPEWFETLSVVERLVVGLGLPVMTFVKIKAEITSPMEVKLVGNTIAFSHTAPGQYTDVSPLLPLLLSWQFRRP